MNLVIIIGFFVIVGLKILHGTDANDDTFDRKLLQKVGDKNARKLRLPSTPRTRTMQLNRRRMNARRGYFRDTTEPQFQSYDTWGAGGQLDLLREEYAEGHDREEYELAPEVLDYHKALRSQIHREGHDAASRQYIVQKLLVKSQSLSKRDKTEDFLEEFKYKGDWVYGRNVTIVPENYAVFNLSLSTSTRKPYYMDKSCLRPCPMIYKYDYGMICAIRWHRPEETTKTGYEWFKVWSGTSQFPTYFLRNFTNLCEMEVANCIMLHLDDKEIYSWKVMFRGACPNGMDDEEETLKKHGPPGNPSPLTDGDKEIEFAKGWLKDIEEHELAVAKARLKHDGNKGLSFNEALNKSRTTAPP